MFKLVKFRTKKQVVTECQTLLTVRLSFIFYFTSMYRTRTRRTFKLVDRDFDGKMFYDVFVKQNPRYTVHMRVLPLV